jgi:glycosyltransferase involved in cell wall biosynthesis
LNAGRQQSLRVALLTGSVSRRGGGVSDVVRSLGKSLNDASRNPVPVIGIHDSETETDRASWGMVPLVALPTAGPAVFGFAPGMGRAIEEAHPDLLHVHGLWMYSSIASQRWAKSTHPYVVTPHGMLDPWAVNNSRWKKRLAGALFEDRHLRGAACLHALNLEEAQAFRAYGLKNPICVIPNGVDLPLSGYHGSASWRPRLPQEAKVLFYIGRLHPKKGLDILLRAWAARAAQAKSSRWHLVIAGWDQAGHEQELRALAAAEGLADSVHFVGPQFGEAKSASFQSADAFVLPSLSEGLPMTVLEAWSHGLPVLMTPQCNLQSGFEVGAALRIEPSPESVAAQLTVLFEMGDADRRAMGEHGLGLVKQRHQWPAIAAQMIEVYEWTLGLGPRPNCLFAG